MTNGANHAGVIHWGTWISGPSWRRRGRDLAEHRRGRSPATWTEAFRIRLRGPNGADLGSDAGALACPDRRHRAADRYLHRRGRERFTVPQGTGSYCAHAGEDAGGVRRARRRRRRPDDQRRQSCRAIHRGDLDQWTFTAAQGDAISAEHRRGMVGEVDPRIQPLDSAAGARTARTWVRPQARVGGADQRDRTADRHLHRGGRSSFTVPSGTGNYLLTLAKTPGTFIVPAGDEGGPMTNGANHPAVIHRGDLDQWTFTAARETPSRQHRRGGGGEPTPA